MLWCPGGGEFKGCGDITAFGSLFQRFEDGCSAILLFRSLVLSGVGEDSEGKWWDGMGWGMNLPVWQGTE